MRRVSMTFAFTLLLAVAASAGTVLFDKTLSLSGITARVTQRDGPAPMKKITVTVRASGAHRATVSDDAPNRVVAAWLADLTAGSHPQVIVATQSGGSGAYGSLLILEWTGTTLRRHAVAGLSPDAARGYMGHDQYSVEGGKIYRMFPLYGPKDPNCCPRGGIRRLVYDFVRNRWRILSGTARLYDVRISNRGSRVGHKSGEQSNTPLPDPAFALQLKVL